MRNLADALFEFRLARLPAGAAEAIELDNGSVRAVARQKFDVLDREIEAVAAGIDDEQAIVRRPSDVEGLEPS